MVRELSDFDPLRARLVLTWPLREALLAYSELRKRQMQERHDVSMVLWALLAPHTKDKHAPPELPEILRG
jgi:hypothetical protein